MNTTHNILFVPLSSFNEIYDKNTKAVCLLKKFPENMNFINVTLAKYDNKVFEAHQDILSLIKSSSLV